MDGNRAKKHHYTHVPNLWLVPIENVRQWEIDFLRGSAIILMVFYHLAYDLIKLGGVHAFVGPLFWRLGPDLIAGSFLIASGLSCYHQFRISDKGAWDISWRHGKRVLSFGILLSLVTLIFTENTIIIFGILHCIGLSIIIGSFFLKSSRIFVGVSALLILSTGWVFEYLGYYQEVFQWVSLNVTATGKRRMLDFFPMLPWFGYYLLGIFLGKTTAYKLYGKFKKKSFYDPILFMGRNSLWIYLIHQPLLLGLLSLFGLHLKI